MLNPDPIVQLNANGFAANVSMNQDEKSRAEVGLIQDYHMLPELLTMPRKVAIVEVEKQEEEEKKNAVLTKNNNFLVNLMLDGLEDK